MAAKANKLNVEEIIQKAIIAQRIINERRSQDAFKATERRLYAIPVLEKKVMADKAKLAEIRVNGTPRRDQSIIRFQRSGYRVEPEEMLDAIINDLESTIAADENEIETVRNAMETFKGDPFYSSVVGRYINRYDDEDIAAELDCGTTQMWKQRTRIVKDIAVMLYGVSAL